MAREEINFPDSIVWNLRHQRWSHWHPKVRWVKKRPLLVSSRMPLSHHWSDFSSSQMSLPCLHRGNFTHKQATKVIYLGECCRHHGSTRRTPLIAKSALQKHTLSSSRYDSTTERRMWSTRKVWACFHRPRKTWRKAKAGSLQKQLLRTWNLRQMILSRWWMWVCILFDDNLLTLPPRVFRTGNTRPPLYESKRKMSVFT